MSGMSRRKVLAGVVTAAAGVAGAGCIGDSEENNGENSELQGSFGSVLDEIKGQQGDWLEKSNDKLVEMEDHIDEPLYGTDTEAEVFHADTGERVTAEDISVLAVEPDQYSITFSVGTNEVGIYSDLEHPPSSEHPDWNQFLGLGLQTLAAAAIGYPATKKEREETENPELYAAFEESTAAVTARMYDADGNDIDVTIPAEKVDSFATMFVEDDNTDVFKSIQYYMMDRLNEEYSGDTGSLHTPDIDEYTNESHESS